MDTSGSAAYDIDVPSREVRRGGDRWRLTPMEFMLLLVLHANAGRVLSQGELQRALYADGDQHDDNVRVMVQRIRRKIRADVIDTRRGLGYGVGVL